jgi:hypothetical protein
MSRDRTKSKDRFAERFERLKSALGVKSDSELAGKVSCAAQSVGGAKKRQLIPAAWLEEAGELGISLDYIFYGDLPVERNLSENASEKFHDADSEKLIAEKLVSIAISETGHNPSPAGKKILERFVKRKVVEDVKSDIIEMLKDVMMSERESEETPNKD